MRTMIFKASMIGLLAAGAPAFAVTKQQAPAPGPERSRIADPDAESDRLAERTERASRRHSYDRTSARSVMDIGNRTPR